MPAAKQRGSSSRASSSKSSTGSGNGGRTSPPQNKRQSSRNGASASNGSSSRGRTSARGSSSRSTNGSSPKSSAGARSQKSQSSQKAPSSPRASSNGSASADTGSVRERITQVVVPAVTGAAGIAGGVLLGRTALQRHRKVLGIPLPGGPPEVKVNMAGISQQIGEAGRQFGRLASEISAARQKAEKLSKAIGG